MEVVSFGLYWFTPSAKKRKKKNLFNLFAEGV